eukprot:scaffold9903_cov106-Isochrysis_galbana.AAC.5
MAARGSSVAGQGRRGCCTCGLGGGSRRSRDQRSGGRRGGECRCARQAGRQHATARRQWEKHGALLGRSADGKMEASSRRGAEERRPGPPGTGKVPSERPSNTLAAGAGMAQGPAWARKSRLAPSAAGSARCGSRVESCSTACGWRARWLSGRWGGM